MPLLLEPHNKHNNIQYQFPPILLSSRPSPQSHISITNSLFSIPQILTTNTITFNIISSLNDFPPHSYNKQSNIHYQFLSVFPSARSKQKSQ
jgi:hypothetical protein